MKKPSDDSREDQLREKLMGLGESSFQKSYYPLLQRKIQELDREKSRFQSVFHNASNGIFHAELSGRILMANPAMADILGYPNRKTFQETAHMRDTVFHNPEDWDSLMEKIRSGRRLQNRTVRLKNREGETVWCLLNLTPVIQEGTVQAEGFLENITVRKKAERDLKETRNYLDAVLNFMPSVIIGVDKNVRITHWNNQAELHTGHTLAQVKGSSLFSVLSLKPEDEQRIRAAVARKQVTRFSRMENPAGPASPIESITVYPLATRGISGAVVKIDDISEQMELERQLAQSRKMDAVGQLAGGIAHDFNNMLGGILGAAELLKEQGLMEADDLLNLIIQSAIRASDLTTELLTFSRNKELKTRPMDGHQVIRSAAALLKSSLDKNIRVSLVFKASRSALEGDETQLQNVFLNLGINAGHAMPDGGELTFRTDNCFLDPSYCKASQFELSPGCFWQAEIVDTGSGILPEHLPRIFDPFFTTKEPGKGTGLGLASVYGIILKHGGEIEAFSRPGEGTILRLRLPVRLSSV